jgi:hypothetical protein
MKEIIEAIDLGWDIEFTNEIKRMEGKDGWRDFISRVCYKAVLLKTINDPSSICNKIKCPWEGFETAQEAVDDLIKKFKPILKK